MERNYFISVAMATYNGEKYIKDQIDSILSQLEKNDELIISDDGSMDNTLAIINSLHDSRIKLIQGPKKGVKQNFANAIQNCNGKYIFLSDQDDVWTEKKVNIILDTFKKEQCTCITHNCDIVNDNLTKIIIPSFFKYRKSKPGVLSNIYKNKYIGCCMAFKQEMKKYILPIPDDIEMHDQWIGIICNKHGKSVFIDKKLIHYRRHNNNVSKMKHYQPFKMIKNRIQLIKNLLKH